MSRNDNSYEAKLKAAGVYEPLSTLLATETAEKTLALGKGVKSANNFSQVDPTIKSITQIDNGDVVSIASDGFAVSKLATDTNASIYPALLTDGAPIVASAGKIHQITNLSSVSVLNGQLVCTDAISESYMVLVCKQNVQYMRALVQFDADCTGTIAFVIPREGGTFPGLIGGTGAPEAGVHCIFTSASNGIVIVSGYGGTAASITGSGGNVTTPVPLVGYTRTLELYMNKMTGRVVVQVDGMTVVDYLDTRTLSYIGKYCIFEFFGAGNKKPKIIEMEASSKLPAHSGDTEANYTGIVHVTATAIPTTWAVTAFKVKSSNGKNRSTVVMVSAWIDQTAGDTLFRFTDGTGYTPQSCVARGTFNGRVHYITKLNQTGLPLANDIQLQCMNSSGTATFGAVGPNGYMDMVTLGATL
jgi:hypothetical protein